MIVDTNVTLSRWPFRRLPFDTTSELVKLLKSQGVSKAWAGNFDALLHQDIGACNKWLFDECKRHGEGLLIPWGTVNPLLPDWEEDLRRCASDYSMPGIRLYPNYHQYKLDVPEFRQLIEAVSQTGLVVQIVRTMEDERTQHPLLQVPNVDLKPLVDMASQFPKVKFILANTFRGMTPRAFAAAFNESKNVYCDIAMLEGVGKVDELLSLVPLSRVLFGSHAPLFYFESAKLKLKEADLGWYKRRAIEAENAKSLLATETNKKN